MTDTIDLDLLAHEFAQAVRSHLTDLDADEVDDLTEGLEADLIEQARETGSFPAGDPAAYASELRAAAGMPVRAGSRPGFITAVRVEFAHQVARVRELVASSAALTALFGFLESMRAIWWVARAWLGFLVVHAVAHLGWHFGAASIVIFGVLLLISIQWGREKWMPRRWVRVVRTLANVLAILMIPTGVFTVGNQIDSMSYSHSSEQVAYPQGLSRDGNLITNIFAYDAAGDPISEVQLFDQNGNALSLRQGSTTSLSTNEGHFLLPTDSAAGSSGWNVFPLGRIPPSAVENNYSAVKAGTVPTRVLFPFVKVRPLTSTTQPTPTPTPSPTPAP